MDLEKLNLKQDKTQQPRLGNEGEENSYSNEVTSPLFSCPSFYFFFPRAGIVGFKLG